MADDIYANTWLEPWNDARNGDDFDALRGHEPRAWWRLMPVKSRCLSDQSVQAMTGGLDTCSSSPCLDGALCVVYDACRREGLVIPWPSLAPWQFHGGSTNIRKLWSMAWVCAVLPAGSRHTRVRRRRPAPPRQMVEGNRPLRQARSLALCHLSPLRAPQILYLY